MREGYTRINALLADNWREVGNHIPLLLSYLGAGIYEEFLFRLLLLSGTIAANLPTFRLTR